MFLAGFMLGGLGWPLAARAADSVPTFPLGMGHSVVVEYDRSFRPLRRYTGLEQPSDVTELRDGTVLLVDSGARRVLVFTKDGLVSWSAEIGAGPRRARPRPGGGLLVTSGNEAVALRADHSVEWQLTVPGLRAAAPLANGNLVVTSWEPYQRVAELTPDGHIVWQSLPRLRSGPEARSRFEENERSRWFLSVGAVDVAPDGLIFLTDYDAHELCLISPDRRTTDKWVIDGVGHYQDTRLGPDGSLVAAAEGHQVWWRRPDSTSRMSLMRYVPTCATWTARGTLLVGLAWEPEASVLNATARRAAGTSSQRLLESPLRLTGLGLAIALVSVLLLRRREIATSLGRWRQAESVKISAGAAEGTAEPHLVGSKRERAPRWLPGILAAVGLSIALAASCLLAWRGVGLLEAGNRREGPLLACLGFLLGGLALRMANALSATSANLSGLAPRLLDEGDGAGRRHTTVLLASLAVLSIGICLAIVLWRRDLEAVAVALWAAAQVWLLGAAFPPRRFEEPQRRSRGASRALLLVIVVVAALMRLWQLGYFPDVVHHDYSANGRAALQFARGVSLPFFTQSLGLDGDTVSRPGFIPAAIAFSLLGAHDWVLRLPSALWGIAMVVATYLAGRELFNRRVGLIGGFLVAVNYALVAYSRVVIVIDSAGPFALSLAFALAALRRGCRFRWCLAGMLAGWTMLLYVAGFVLPVVFAAVLAAAACIDHRWLWRNRFGVLWACLGVLVVYLPMLQAALHGSTVGTRLVSSGALLDPDGRLKHDLVLWLRQLEGSFGAIICEGDRTVWLAAVGPSICLRLGSCLFGIGLVYLFTVWRGLATYVVLAWVSLPIFIGSTLINNPPLYSHFLTAFPPILLIAGLALDRALAPLDRLGRVGRAGGAVVSVCLLAAVAAAHTATVFSSGVSLLRASETERTRDCPEGVAARFIRRHPDLRYFLVRTIRDRRSDHTLFSFYAADSDLSDLTDPLDETLPLAPVDPAPAAAFLVLPSRAEERETLLRVYPTASCRQFACDVSTLTVCEVPAASVRDVYAARRESR